MPDLLSLADAHAAVQARVRPLSAEDVDVGEASGRVLAEDARAVVDLPPFDASAMDGFAIRAADVPGRLEVVQRIAAGTPATASLRERESMGIATGGVVPDGADAVIKLEDVVETDNVVEIPVSVAAGDNIRPRGGDLHAGDVVVSRGTRLTPAQIGALAAAGCARVSCGRRPRIAVVATGTELRRPGETLGGGQVYEANGSMLAAALTTANADVTTIPFVADDERVHRDALERAFGADVVVTSGGVSVGPHDLVRRVAGELGVEEIFWRVAVKPGKPVSFGVRGDTLVFGLPGNPVSSLVGCELFVRPALLALQGAAEPGPPYEPGRIATDVRRNRGRDELLRARRLVRDDTVVLEPVTGQESHMIARAATADALVFVPRGEGVLQAGAAVRYLRLG
ncbi:MAG: gephyrin-like molybdotransferase Glp [Gaiellaceae bacterium]